MNTTQTKKLPAFGEFIIILSLLMSLTALSIDTVLPALSQISRDLAVEKQNDRQLVISIIFLGQAIGQLYFGPLSDSTGRKRAIYAGYALFLIGSLISGFAGSFSIMLAGRTLQGIGVSAPRGVSLALVRDLYEGRTMARVMSFATMVFILVPTIAPSLGQGILAFTGWRAIFVFYILFAVVSIFWFSFRMPETLAKEDRIPFTWKRIKESIREIMKIRSVLGFTIASGLIYGIFIGYLNSSQQIFQEQYGLGELFPLYFSSIALSLGTAAFMNSRLVMRFGMRKLVHWALRVQTALSGIFVLAVIILEGQPPLWSLMVFLMMFFFCTGLLFGNINALAMQPLGKLAGIGSGVVGSFSTMISMLLGTVVGRSYNGTILPLIVGMIILTAGSILIVHWATASQHLPSGIQHAGD